MNNQISLTVSFEGQKPEKIKVYMNSTVAQFLDDIKLGLKIDNIKYVYFKGRQLNPNELLLNNIENRFTDIYFATNSLEKKEEDFEPMNSKLDSEHESEHESKFKIYTTASAISFLHGNKINLKLSFNYDEVLQEIKKLIDSFSLTNELPKNYEAHIFLPGGVPFNDCNMTLSTFFSSKNIQNYRMYVVITRELGDFIDEEVTEPCNFNHFNKNMLSPLFETTDFGLTQIGSLLGYFYHGGIYSELLLNIIAKISRFTPLITNLYRVIKNEKLNVLNIVSITGPLCTLFNSLIEDFEHEKIFEYTLQIVSFISLIWDVETLDLRIYDCEKEDQEEDDKKLVEYLKNTDQQDHVVIWESDINSYCFKGFNVDAPQDIFDNDVELLNIVSKFKTVSPLSLKFFCYPTFVQCAKDNEVLLFINHNDEGLVNIVDPKVGKVEQISIENLVIKTGNEEVEDHFSVIDNCLIEQLTIICVDESLTQNQLVKEFLTKFVEKSTKHNDFSVYGLVTFGDKVNSTSDYFLMSPQFIEEINKIEPVDKSFHLYDALDEALKVILKDLNNDDDDDDDSDFDNLSYENAEFRVIVISNDGIDVNSTVSPAALANKFIHKNVLIDVVLVSDIENTILPTLSKLTGGLCINIKDGLKFIDQEAFINVKKRFRDLPFVGTVTEGTLKDKKSFSFDKEVKSRENVIANSIFSLATPKHVNDFYKNRTKTLKIQRALDELKFIQMNPSNNFVIYSNIIAPDEWRIFIKGPAGSPFENKWLNCFMYLPNLYPFVPPSFTFLSIPFHPNVSCEGKISFGLIENNYKKELKICYIIDGIVKILGNPEEDSVVNKEAYEMFKSDKSAFLEKQRKSETGKNDYNEYLHGMKIFE